MKLKGSQIITNLRENLRIEIGRHLYAVLGGYEQLNAFEKNELSQLSSECLIAGMEKE